MKNKLFTLAIIFSIFFLSETTLAQFYYCINDHLGNTRVVVDEQGNVKEYYDYYPFGKTLRSSITDEAVATYKYTGKELDDENDLDWYYFGARYYDPNIGRWLSPDPREEFPSPYIYCGNNPINLIDPTGKSTITDSSGNVIEVYDDRDLGVYREVEGGGLMYMGETEFWDEFIDPETNKIGGRILFEESWDTIIEELHNLSTEMNLVEIAQNSRPGKKFDIKASNPMEGRLLEDKYATARSAGNYLAAYNARYGTLLGAHISYTTFVKLAGALHQGQFNYVNAAKIVLFGTSYGPPPWYGEIGYAGRMFPMGWNRRK